MDGRLIGNDLWVWKYMGNLGKKVFQKTRIDHVVVVKITASMHPNRHQMTQGHPFHLNSILESPKHHPSFL